MPGLFQVMITLQMIITMMIVMIINYMIMNKTYVYREGSVINTKKNQYVENY